MWRRYVEDLIFERNNPGHAAAKRAREERRPTARSGGGTGPPAQHREWLSSKEEGGTDRAYARAYLEPDKKRIKRD